MQTLNPQHLAGRKLLWVRTLENSFLLLQVASAAILRATKKTCGVNICEYIAMASTNPLDDSEQVEKGLQASVFVHAKLDEVIKAHADTDYDYVTISKKDANKMRRLVARCNYVLSSSVRMAHAREDRLELELEILKASTVQEHILRDANRARNYERLREVFERLVQSTSTTSGPSSSKDATNEVDRVINASLRIETALAKLAPVASLDTHGAGLVTAMREGKLNSVLAEDEKMQT